MIQAEEEQEAERDGGELDQGVAAVAGRPGGARGAFTGRSWW